MIRLLPFNKTTSSIYRKISRYTRHSVPFDCDSLSRNKWFAYLAFAHAFTERELGGGNPQRSVSKSDYISTHHHHHYLVSIHMPTTSTYVRRPIFLSLSSYGIRDGERLSRPPNVVHPQDVRPALGRRAARPYGAPISPAWVRLRRQLHHAGQAGRQEGRKGTTKNTHKWWMLLWLLLFVCHAPRFAKLASAIPADGYKITAVKARQYICRGEAIGGGSRGARGGGEGEKPLGASQIKRFSRIYLAT